jgi:uncharacterized protein YjbI with pentapeptide repeats
MADDQQIKILKEGVQAWNRWREENPETVPDLKAADLSRRSLEGINFKRARLENSNLGGSNLSDANLHGANLAGTMLIGSTLRRTGFQSVRLHQVDMTASDMEESNLFEAQLHHSRLLGVNLRKSNLTGAEFLYTELSRSNLSESNCYSALFDQANLRGANLRGASLEKAHFIESNLEEADLSECKVYNLSAWNLKLPGAIEKELVISNGPNPVVVLDTLELSRRISRTLYYSELQEGIEQPSFPVVLILGKFFDMRKKILEGMKEQLRRRHYIPVSLESSVSAPRMKEFLLKLARYSLFMIVDLTGAGDLFRMLVSSAPELQLPVQIIEESLSKDPDLFQETRIFPMILPVYRYEGRESLLNGFAKNVVSPGEQKFKEMKEKKKDS